MTMNITQHWAELVLLPVGQLRTYAEAVGKLADLRAQVEAAVTAGTTTAEALPEAAAVTPPPLGPGANQPRLRGPMRPPAPGSLRASVHEVLAQARGSLPRAAIAEQVAANRGVRVDDKLINAVGEVLRNRHDRYIRKVATGVYIFVPEGQHAKPRPDGPE